MDPLLAHFDEGTKESLRNLQTMRTQSVEYENAQLVKNALLDRRRIGCGAYEAELQRLKQGFGSSPLGRAILHPY